jgi:ABC-type transport system involved in cytochrome bd biosynthesis fused ATPase/permease subunit
MFMRFNTGKICLVLVDEPSAALDPMAEQDIFRNLLAEREGKTIVFVTHHFAYLTSKADQIMYGTLSIAADPGHSLLPSVVS